MDFGNVKLLSLMKVKMAWHAENQDALARNVANADTPGYQPTQLKELDFKRLAMIEARRLRMKATSPAHMSGVQSPQDFREVKQRKTYETTPVKNRVALEEQMAKVAFNKHEYDMTTNLYRKTTQMFKTAIGNN